MVASSLGQHDDVVSRHARPAARLNIGPRWLQRPVSRALWVVAAAAPEERARRALTAGRLQRARRIGTSLLGHPIWLGRWNIANRVHWGHVVLGLADVRAGDDASAEQHLLAAGSAAAALGGSPQLNSFGPDFDLAAQLLEHGRRDAVGVYLNSCKVFWSDPRSVLDAWETAIRNGEQPRLRRFAETP